MIREQTDTGMARLSLSDDDRHVRDWFVETTKSLGCTVQVDKMVSNAGVYMCRDKCKVLMAPWVREIRLLSGKAEKTVHQPILARI